MRNERSVLLIALLVGIAFRITYLGYQSLWLDEFTTLEVARRSLAEIWGGAGFDSHTPPFYYLLMHGWLTVFSESEFSLRFPSVLFDLGNICLVAVVVRQLFPGTVSGFAALLYATSPFAIYYAQEARMYSLLVCEILCCLCLFIGMRHGEKPFIARLGLIVVAAIGCYTHYYFCLFLAALAFAGFVVLWPNRSEMRTWFFTLAIVGVCYLPWLSVVLTLAASGGQHFRSYFWLVFPYTLFRFIYGYGIFPISEGYKETAVQEIAHLWWLFLPSVLALTTIVWLGLSRFKNFERDKFVIIVTVPLVVVAAATALSLVTPMLSERYLSSLFPFFVIILALGATNLFFKGALVLTSLVGSMMYFVSSDYGKAQWREVGQAIAAEAADGDIVAVSPPYLEGVLNYYLKRSQPLPEVPAVMRSKNALPLQWLAIGDTQEIAANGSVWLVESADMPSLKEKMRQIGLIAGNAKIFPKENGIHLTRFSFKDPQFN